MSNSKNKKWTAEDAAYVRQNLGKVSLDDMASHLARSSMAVRLYILRNRLTVGRTVKRNLLLEMLKIKFRHPEDFNPTRAFYNETGIGQRRYWNLYFGRKPITGKEYAAIAEYLHVTIHEAFESRQLELFEEKEK
uniref:XRE family transcriptional regulator n=1 Tax=Prevotella sp. GTC17262 TaxID=3236797 RepID=A0AB33JID0_9BACT